MTERPILFSGPMVRAILEGRKTQTRRVVKPQPDHPAFSRRKMLALDDEGIDLYLHGGPLLPRAIRCPYGRDGNRLWVRESWSPDPPCDGPWGYISWAGCRDGKIAGVPERFRHPAFCNYAADWLHGPITWTPSIHMPRWASRINLRITGVRVERLQDISADDAKAEGISEFIGGWWCEHDDTPQIAGMTPQDGYRKIWERINGADSWAANPWVWVVSFERDKEPGNG